MTPEEEQRLAEEAERGYDVERLRKRAAIYRMRDASPPKWYADCQACDHLGPLRPTREEARADARAHNREHHPVNGR